MKTTFIVTLSAEKELKIYADRVNEIKFFSTGPERVKTVDFLDSDNKVIAQYALNNILGWREDEATS